MRNGMKLKKNSETSSCEENKLNFEELIEAYNSIVDETPSQWVIAMSYEERIHYDKHPPTPEEIELLVRERGAMEVTSRGIKAIRFPDKLLEIFKQMEEFKDLD